MSRRSYWMLAVLMLVNVAPAAVACPGSLAIGLPLLFGSDDPTPPLPAPTQRDTWPVINLPMPGDLEEAQENRDQPARKEMAKECLKAWRQLIRDRRYELAPALAAKAVALDPTNLDAQHAVIVTQVLRSIDGKVSVAATKSCAASSCCSSCQTDDCPAMCCPACAKQSSVAAPKIVRSNGVIELKLSLSPSGVSFLPTIKFQPAQSASKSSCGEFTTLKNMPALVSDGTKPRCFSGKCSQGQSSDNSELAEQLLKLMFPRGMLAGDAPCKSAPPFVVATPVSSTTTKATTGFAIACPIGMCPAVECTQIVPASNGHPVYVQPVSHVVPAASKRVSIKTAAWLVECDRVILMDEREMIVDGNVNLTGRLRDVNLHGGRVHINLNDGSVRVDSK